MIGLLKAMGFVKAALAVGTLTAVTAFAATQASLPAASDAGQAHASAAAANRAESGKAESGKDVTTITDRLAANKARLLTTLHDVLSRLKANAHVNSHAIDALTKVIDRITNGDTGLNRASDAFSNGGASSDHPSTSDHPSRS